MKYKKRQRIVFLADLEEHSAREACLGAAQYAANVDKGFEPWSLRSLYGHSTSSPSDFLKVDGLLLTHDAAKLVFGEKPKINIPHVFIMGKSFSAKSPAVELDEVAIGRMAAEHLLHRGYQTVISVASPSLDWSQLRIQGFNDECRKHKVEAINYPMSEEALSPIWQPNSLGHNDQLNRIISTVKKPCGVFAMNDVAACFVIETARLCKVRIPAQMGVIGVDNDLIPNAAAGLSISSVEPPFRALGRKAAEVLDNHLSNKEVPLRTIMPPIRIVVRASTDVFMVENSLVRRAQAYIEERRAGHILVAEVAKAIGTTTVTLGNRFREHLSITTSEYILRRRIEYAKELLRKGELNVEEVSNVCGFHCCSYFCHVFKRMTSATPGSFR
jgi:LacI family transcriptional regulator